MPRHIGVRVGSISETPPAVARMGWELTTSNVGLAGVGVDRTSLPAYTGPLELPHVAQTR